MSTKLLNLSASGLKNIIDDKPNFRFIFGDHELIVSRFTAEFLSPTVSRIHLSDPTIDSITFKIKLGKNCMKDDDLICENHLQLFEEISKGNEIKINEKEGIGIRNISILLGNKEIYSKINELFPKRKNDINIECLLYEIETIEILKRQNVAQCIDISDIINLISNNMYCIDKEDIKQIPIHILHQIIQNDELKISSEDSLFDIINEIFDENDFKNIDQYDELYMPCLNEMYEAIEILNLSENKFVELLNRIDPTEMTNSLWTKLCERMMKQPNERNKNFYQANRYCVKSKPKTESTIIFNCPFDGNESCSMNGIIRKLTKRKGGNVHDKGAIRVTASSDYGNGNDISNNPKFVVDLDNTLTRFTSNNVENSWLTYDFKNHKVHPTHYSIRSRTSIKGDWHPRNWVIEGSNDGTEWKILDSRKNVNVLNESSVTHTFEIEENLESNDYYRYLRIRQTGLNARNINNSSNNGYILSFSALEYFGSMI